METTLCGQCEASPATLECMQCQEVYCQSCGEEMHSKGRLKQHDLIPLGVNASQFCNVHSGEKLALFCTDCREPVCAHCMVVGNHVKHHCRPLKRASSETRERIQSKLEVLRSRKIDVEGAICDLDRALTRLSGETSAAQDYISSCFDDLREALRKREEEVLVSLGQAFEGVRDTLGNKVAESRTELDNLGVTVDAGSRLLAKDDDYDFIVACGEVESTMDALANVSWRPPDHPPVLCVTLDTRGVLQSMKKLEIKTQTTAAPESPLNGSALHQNSIQWFEQLETTEVDLNLVEIPGPGDRLLDAAVQIENILTGSGCETSGPVPTHEGGGGTAPTSGSRIARPTSAHKSNWQVARQVARQVVKHKKPEGNGTHPERSVPRDGGRLHSLSPLEDKRKRHSSIRTGAVKKGVESAARAV